MARLFAGHVGCSGKAHTRTCSNQGQRLPGADVPWNTHSGSTVQLQTCCLDKPRWGLCYTACHALASKVERAIAMGRVTTTYVFALTLALACLRCAVSGEADTKPEKPATDYSQVVAIVNEDKITRGDLAEALILVSGHRALDVLVKRRLIDQEAAKLSITVTNKEIEEGIKNRVDDLVTSEMRERGYDDKKSFERFLATQEMTSSSFRERVRASLSPDIRAETVAVLKALKLIQANIEVADEEITARFDEVYGPRIHARQIVLRTRREAHELLRKLRGGADFGRLARTHSIARVSAVQEGKMKKPLRPADKELWAVVASLKAGQVSEVARTRYGYHILKVEDVSGQQNVKLVDVKEQLATSIRERKGRDYLRTWYVKLLERVDVRKMLEVQRPRLLGIQGE